MKSIELEAMSCRTTIEASDRRSPVRPPVLMLEGAAKVVSLTQQQTDSLLRRTRIVITIQATEVRFVDGYVTIEFVSQGAPTLELLEK